MKKVLLALALFSIFSSQSAILHAQSDPVVMEVGGRQVRQSEFMKDFRQSVGDNLVKKNNVTEAEKRAAFDEYIELYANFRAKYLDALSMGMDTTMELRRELNRYRKDLAAPYLIDSAALQALLNEAYERNHYAVHAAHILVRVKTDAKAEDTLAAYNRALELRKRVADGEDFFAVAREEVLRVNPDAQVQPYEGELSCFTVFEMVYPFENAAYNLPIGEISDPVRSQYGYHIIKVFDRIEIYGRMTIQHIWLRNPNRKNIDLLYERLQNGTSFEMAARQSDDYSSAKSGGYINDAGISQLPYEYLKAVSTMKPGEISRPFSSRYGWHIVKLVSKDTIPPLSTLLPFYKQRMSRDQRGNDSRKLFAIDCRKRYGIRDLTNTPAPSPKAKAKGKKKSKQPVVMMASLDELRSKLTDSVFSARWKYTDTTFSDLRPLVSVPGKDYNVLDVARYIRAHQRMEDRTSLLFYVRTQFDNFLDSVTIAYADSQLEKEHPDFADVVDEYRRGLMIFNYNEKMIWTKAINDSTGFADFYARESVKKSLDNPADSLFFWKTRARMVVFNVADSSVLDPSKALKIVRKGLDKNLASNEIQDQLVKKAKGVKGHESVTFSVEVIEKTKNHLLADNQWKRGVYILPEGKGYRLLMVQSIIPPVLKAQMEARGYYLNAWQNEVEKNLCRSLRDKYNVKINYDALHKIAY